MDEKVSRGSIVFLMAASAGAMIATAYIGVGLWSMREVAGFVLGIALSLLLVGQTMGRIYRRGSAGVDKAIADAELDEIRARLEPETERFERFVPASPMLRAPSGGYPAPDVTAKIYRDDSTQIINGFRHDW